MTSQEAADAVAENRRPARRIAQGTACDAPRPAARPRTVLHFLETFADEVLRTMGQNMNPTSSSGTESRAAAAHHEGLDLLESRLWERARQPAVALQRRTPRPGLHPDPERRRGTTRRHEFEDLKKSGPRWACPPARPNPSIAVRSLFPSRFACTEGG